MPAQKYYAVDGGDTGSTPPTNGPTATGSAVWPNGTDNTGGLIHLQLETPGTYTGARLFNNSRTSLAQTARQSARLGYMWVKLGAGTVPSGTYRLQALVSEANNAANTFLGLSIYVWRPSTTSVVGRVYDSTAELGTEFPTTAAEQTWSVTGSAVTCQAGDYLIVEVWLTAAQGMATAYSSTFRADFPQTGEDDFFETPDVLPPPPITATATAASDGGGVTATGRSNPGGAATAASDGGGATADAKQRNAGTVSAASDGGGAAASGTQRNAGTATAASDGGGVTATGIANAANTGEAASDGGGVTASAKVRIAGTATAGSESGATGTALVRILATATAGSEGGATGTVRILLVATGTAGSEGGVTSAGLLAIRGTMAGASEGGATGSGVFYLLGTGAAGSESGATATGGVALSGTAQAASESGALGSATIVFPPVTGGATAGSDGGGVYAVGRLVVVLLPGMVGRHAIDPFHSPTQGRAVNPDVVRGNDTILQRAFNSHDEDPTIHIQSSTMDRRPAAGTAGRIWITEDSGVYELWFDDGSTWQSVT